MAGTIDFRTGVWGCSGGSFRAMAHGVVAHLGTDEISAAVRATLNEQVESNVLYLDFEADFQPPGRAAFRAALQRYREQLAQGGPSALANPDLFAGHVERMEALSKLVDEALA